MLLSSGLSSGFHGVAIFEIPGSIPRWSNVETNFNILFRVWVLVVYRRYFVSDCDNTSAPATYFDIKGT